MLLIAVEPKEEWAQRVKIYERDEFRELLWPPTERLDRVDFYRLAVVYVGWSRGDGGALIRELDPANGDEFGQIRHGD
jgi:hypothetical protein